MNEDSLKINYDEETNQFTLEWDSQDPEWNWLADLTEDQIHDMIAKNAQKLLDEIGNETETD